MLFKVFCLLLLCKHSSASKLFVDGVEEEVLLYGHKTIGYAKALFPGRFELYKSENVGTTYGSGQVVAASQMFLGDMNTYCDVSQWNITDHVGKIMIDDMFTHAVCCMGGSDLIFTSLQSSGFVGDICPSFGWDPEAIAPYTCTVGQDNTAPDLIIVMAEQGYDTSDFEKIANPVYAGSTVTVTIQHDGYPSSRAADGVGSFVLYRIYGLWAACLFLAACYTYSLAVKSKRMRSIAGTTLLVEMITVAPIRLYRVAFQPTVYGVDKSVFINLSCMYYDYPGSYASTFLAAMIWFKVKFATSARVKKLADVFAALGTVVILASVGTSVVIYSVVDAATIGFGFIRFLVLFFPFVFSIMVLVFYFITSAMTFASVVKASKLSSSAMSETVRKISCKRWYRRSH
jgi:hypothetical protein